MIGKASYYSGSSLSGATAKWTVQAQPFPFVLPGKFAKYTVGAKGVDVDLEKCLSSFTEDNGCSYLRIEFSGIPNKLAPLRIQTFLEVISQNNDSDLTETSFFIHPAPVHIGIYSNCPSIQSVDQLSDFQLEIVAIDPSTNELIEGFEIFVSVTIYLLHSSEIHQSFEFISALQPEKRVLDLSAHANYARKIVITASTLNFHPEAISELEIAVLTPHHNKNIQQQQNSEERDSFKFFVDESTLQIGEKVKFNFQTETIEKGVGLFAIVKYGFVFWEVLQFSKDQSNSVQFMLEEKIIPNIKAIACVHGFPSTEMASLKETIMTTKHLSIQIPLDSLQLHVRITPEQSILEPGESSTVLIETFDSSMQPIQCEVGLLIVDEAILQLANYSPITKDVLNALIMPPPFQHSDKLQQVSSRTQVAYFQSELETNAKNLDTIYPRPVLNRRQVPKQWITKGLAISGASYLKF